LRRSGAKPLVALGRASAAQTASARGLGRAATDPSQLGAMGKAFSIIEIVAARREPLTMADIVRSTGLTKPTAHRITGLLIEMGFIARDPERRGFIEGDRLIGLALSTLAAAAPRTMRHAILKALSEHIGETCNFGILVGSEVVYLDRVEAKWPLGLRFEAGSHVPAHCTAIGKLLLAQLPARERQHMLAAMPLTRYTGRTIVDVSRLATALDQIGRDQIGTDDNEFLDGVVCVSVPVRGQDGRVIGAIATSAPQARITLDKAMRFVPQMRDAAAKLGATFAR
jgi:DNA-binding IclR family transcriptional regulator